jgi:Polysaccharide pyruvyl transferase
MYPPQKVGVLTFHRCINYGSYWQARCLVEGLHARGHDAVLLDHDSPQVNRAEWRCALQPLLPARVPRSDYRLYAGKARRFFEAFERLPRSRRFPLDRPDVLEGHDLIVVGSDEVWNQHHPWYRGYSLFYGAGLNARRLVSYAASFGNHDASDGLDDGSAANLRAFAAISVRDDNSRRLVRDALGAEPELVLDPCLQFPPTVEPNGEAAEPAYVAVYGHSFPAWFGLAVRDWATSRGLRLLSIGYRNDWADEQRIAAGPEEFARLIAQAAAVATNFFHGCVFALLNRKPFACVSSDYRSNKVRDLMRSVGTEARLVTEAAGPSIYAELLDPPLDPAIADRLAVLRRQSDRYLDHALA